MLADKDNSVSEIQEKLDNIFDEEREILEFQTVDKVKFVNSLTRLL